jgi:hypothetical protein
MIKAFNNKIVPEPFLLLLLTEALADYNDYNGEWPSATLFG